MLIFGTPPCPGPRCARTIPWFCGNFPDTTTTVQGCLQESTPGSVALFNLKTLSKNLPQFRSKTLLVPGHGRVRYLTRPK